MKLAGIILAFLFIQCNKPNGYYSCSLLLNDSTTLSFSAVLTKNTFTVINGLEQIVVPVKIATDSFVAVHPVFNSELVFAKGKEGNLSGYWYNKEKGNYKIPFKAQPVLMDTKQESKVKEIVGKWEVHFSPGTADEYPAIGEFNYSYQRDRIEGTFLTETGDYRFLSGTFNQNKLQLNTFDFSHAFHFQAQYDSGSNMLKGVYYSGNHWSEDWVAVRNNDFTLQDALTLTTVNDSVPSITFLALNGDTVSLDDFKDKAMVIQAFGSWCPNCYDEARFLDSIYPEYKNMDVVFIGLGFERPSTVSESLAKLTRFKTGLALNYNVFYAGSYKKDSALKKLSFLNEFTSYPTLIFLDKQHKLQYVHTGFSGPGTGKHYVQTKKEIKALIARIINP